MNLLCAIGVHGPNWFGNPPNSPRSSFVVGFVRQCEVCGQKWYGTEVETRTMRTLGDWRTERQLRRAGEWEGK